MTSTSRSKRQKRQRTAGHDPQVQHTKPVARRSPFPEWKWRTFPVFFALVLGLTVGAQAGVVAQAASNASAMFLLAIFWLVLGFAVSRVFVRYILARRMVRTKQR